MKNNYFPFKKEVIKVIFLLFLIFETTFLKCKASVTLKEFIFIESKKCTLKKHYQSVPKLLVTYYRVKVFEVKFRNVV